MGGESGFDDPNNVESERAHSSIDGGEQTRPEPPSSARPGVPETPAPVPRAQALEDADKTSLFDERPIPSERWRPFVVLRRALTETRIARVNGAQAVVDEDKAHRAAHDARVALEGEQLRLDPDGLRPWSLPVCIFGAVVLAAIDALPAWWAAEALGDGYGTTALVTILLVAALAGFAVLMSTFRHGQGGGAFDSAMALSVLLVLLESGLRARYLIDVNNAVWKDWLLDVGLLGLITAGLIWISYNVVVRAESLEIYRLRSTAEELDSTAEAATAYRRMLDMKHRRCYTALAHLWRSQVEMHPELLGAIQDELQNHDAEADVVQQAKPLAQ